MISTARGKKRLKSIWKTQLVRFLYERGWTRHDILELFRLIDWLMVLPDDLERDFQTDLESTEQEKTMPYITSIERRGIEKGLSQGLSQGLRDTIQAVLEVRFGGIDAEVLAELKSLDDLSILQAARAAVPTVASVGELRAIWSKR